jgi:ABC-2 type transport system ATP-binding protein
MAAAISVSELVKSYGRVQALDGLDLAVEEGEVHGFLGPNGAGKSTTVRVLTGLLRPDAGTATVLGAHPRDDAVALHRRVAYVPGDVNLWPTLTGGEVLGLLARVRGGGDRRRREELVARFELDPTKKTRTYSKGNRQKVALIAALSADAEVLILDEPTTGLDPLMEAVFADCIHEVRRAGRTVLLSSHILAQVEALSDRVTLIRSGRAVQSGSLAELRHLTRTTIVAETEQPPVGMGDVPGVHGLEVDARQLRFEVEAEHLDAAVARLGGYGLRSLVSRPPTLEELFHRHYNDEEPVAGRGQAAAVQAP